MARKKQQILTYGVGIGDVNERWERTYNGYLNEWMETCVSMFDWKNLPENEKGQKPIDPWFLEKELFKRGKAVFFKDDMLGYMVCMVANDGTLDIYQNPVTFSAESNTGYTKQLDQNSGVIIYANPDKRTKYNRLELYATRLAEIQMVIDCNIKTQKFPPLMFTTSEKQLTAKNIMLQYQGNEPAIFADVDFDPKSMTCVNLNAPYVVDKLQQEKHEILNEVYTFLGIDNTNTQKKERLIQSEVRSNNGQIQAARERMLYMRKLACKNINRLFGLNVDVEFRKSIVQGGEPDAKDERPVSESPAAE